MNTSHFKFWPARVPRELEYPQVPLFEFLETSARRYPNNAGLIYYGQEISFRELWEQVQKLATALFDLGVKKGDRVALYLQNTPHFFLGFFGIMRANAVVVPINPMLTEDEIKVLLEDSGTTVVITAADNYVKVKNIQGETSVREVIVGEYNDYLPTEAELPVPKAMRSQASVGDGAQRWLEVLGAYSPDPPAVEVGVDDMAMLPYTSGSTGIPKGCIHTHATIISNTISSAIWNNMVAGNVILCTLPLFHVTGLIHSMLAPVYAGATTVQLTRWDRETAITAIEKYKCSGWTNITTMVVDMLNHPDISKRDLSSLMAVGGGGAPLPEVIGQKLYEISGLKYMEGYGMTETISQTHFNPPDRPKMQCIGIPDFGVDSRIISLDTGQELNANEEGELVINGPEVMKGYWNRPEDNKQSFIEIDGKKFLKTGDICKMDEEGYYYIIDRSKRMINAAGFKVWPTEVEGVLYQHPAVAELCVVGVPDPVRVENVKAFVVLRQEYQGKISEEEFIKWAKGKMAAYRYPRIIEFVSQLPKSGSGKVQWRQLQQMEKDRIAKDGYYWLKES